MELPSVQTTVNSTMDADSSFHIASGAVLAAAIMEIIIILVGTVGNLLTIAAVLRNKNLQYAANYLIVSLAVADLLVSTILVPMRASQHISYQYQRTIPTAFVQVAGFVGRVNIIASISTLVCLSVDRYIALSKPLRYATSIRYNLRKVSIAIATIWILAIFITSIPKFSGVNDTPFLIFFVVFVLTATLVICVMYYRIFKIVAQNVRRKTKREPIRYSKNIQTMVCFYKNQVCYETYIGKTSTLAANACTDSVKDRTENTPPCSERAVSSVHPGETLHGIVAFPAHTTEATTPCETRGPQFSREERKAAKTISFIVLAFVVLVYPRIIMILHHFDQPESPSSKLARFWTRVLLYLNSAVNPLFYAYHHKGFRNEFKKMGIQCLGLGESI